MARPPSLITRIRDLITPKNKPVPNGDIQSTTTARQRRRSPLRLATSEPMVRLILGDQELTRDLLEVMEWSPEAMGAVDFLSGDPFQQMEGQTSSWDISETRDGSEDGPKVHPDVMAIAQEVRQRVAGREYVIGGDRLQSVHANQLWLGDGYAEIEISKDGAGNYAVSRLVDRPSLQVFNQVENNQITGYQLRTGTGPNDEVIEIPWWKMIHLSHRGRQGRYGKPLFQAQIDSAWRPLKSTAEDLLDVIRNNGTAPLVHSFGADATPEERERYQLSIEQQRETQITTDLFMANGGKVARVASGDTAISGILEAVIHYRTLMVPPGVPAWLFSGLKAGDSSKELANQPAYAYSRRQGSYRSQLGAQIKWVIALEIVMKKGYDFFIQEGQFEIEWPKWLISGLDLAATTQVTSNAATEQKLNGMMAQLERTQGRLMSLDNVGRLIEEVEKQAHG